MIVRAYLVMGLLLMYLSAIAQDTSDYKPFRILPVPTFGYAPETKTYLGTVALMSLDAYNSEFTRTSNASVELTYTFNKQYLANIDWNYFFNREEWFTTGHLQYSRYPDLVFSRPKDEYYTGFGLPYENTRHIADVRLYRKLFDNIFVGGNLRYIAYLNAESPIISQQDTKVQGIGLAFLLDTRDNVLTATDGEYFDLLFTANRGGQKNNLKGYYKLILDIRKYKSVWRNSVVSFRFFNHWNLNRIQPFYEEAFVGGDAFVRGFFYGKYRNQHLSTIQLEWRVPLFWRIAISTFGGISDSYDARSGFREDLFYNIGMGLRFLVDKKEGTNLRIDYALGRAPKLYSTSNVSYWDKGFYVSFGESF